jgi:hypothetical protein
LSILVELINLETVLSVLSKINVPCFALEIAVYKAAIYLSAYKINSSPEPVLFNYKSTT